MLFGANQGAALVAPTKAEFKAQVLAEMQSKAAAAIQKQMDEYDFEKAYAESENKW